MGKLLAGHMATLTIDGDKFRAGIVAVDDTTVTYVDVEAAGTCRVPLEDVTKVQNVGAPCSDADRVALGLAERPALIRIHIPAEVPRNSRVVGRLAVENVSTVGGSDKKSAVSKLDRATELFKAAPGAPREQIVASFMNELSMTKAGALAYFYNIKKKVPN